MKIYLFALTLILTSCAPCDDCGEKEQLVPNPGGETKEKQAK